MNGLLLSKEYYSNVAEPKLKQEFPELYPRLAAGLVGNGSECFGFDDDISRDHDWGIDFFIWTIDDDKDSINSLGKWKSELLRSNPPKHQRTRSEYGARVSVMTCAEFYTSLIGSTCTPKTQNEFLRVPEENFAMSVNGGVFYDGAGEFTRVRSDLLRYLPEDIRRKRIAAKCMALAQTGQYNYSRTAKRSDWVTLRTVLSRFTDSAIAMVFLLNKVYRPYYKWAYRAMKELPLLGAVAAKLLLQIAEISNYDETSQKKHEECISQLCGLFATELKIQGLSQSNDWFLTSHGEDVRSGISDDFLRSLPAQYEI